MRRAIPGILFILTLAWPLAALPCGGGFGQGLSIDPSQKIVLVHKNGVETYIFSPHFCGRAAEFGLILPVPDKLVANPTLGDRKLVDELEAYTAPKIEKQRACYGRQGGRDAGGISRGDGGSNGVTVVNRGQVGIFDWVLLKAD